MKSTLLLAMGLVLLVSPTLFAQQDAPPKKVLFLTKSQGFQHSVIQRDAENPEKLAYAEQLLTDIGAKNGFEITVTKDASVFNDPATFDKYDVFAFYTTGDLTKAGGPDGAPGMSKEAKKAFIAAIEGGKGFIAFHSATDTFHSKPGGELLRSVEVKDEVDPYIFMIGGEFVSHGSQQMATQKFVSPHFPGLADLKDFSFVEEWYSFRNLAPDMHVILVQDTTTMNVKGQREPQYRGVPYPATWCRMQGKGRVFYTSMGHREDVWLKPVFQQVVLAGLNWVSGKTQYDPKPNMAEVAPQAAKESAR